MNSNEAISIRKDSFLLAQPTYLNSNQSITPFEAMEGLSSLNMFPAWNIPYDKYYDFYAVAFYML